MRPKTAFILYLITVLLLLPSVAGYTAVDDPILLLPKDRAVEEWVKDGPEMYYYDFSLDRVLDLTTSDVVFEYGFFSMLSQYYVLNDAEIEIRIYQMNDNEEAFGLFSVFADIPRPVQTGEVMLNDPDAEIQTSTTTESRWIGESEYHLVGDNFFVQLVANDGFRKSDLLRLGGKIQSKFDKSGGDVYSIDLLPGKNRIYASERYIPGVKTLGLYLNLGRFDPFLMNTVETRCVGSEYHQADGRIFKLFVFEYEDEETAEEAYISFRDWIDSVVYYKRRKVADSVGTIYAEDENEGLIAVNYDKNLLRLYTEFEDIEKMRDIIRSHVRGD